MIPSGKPVDSCFQVCRRRRLEYAAARTVPRTVSRDPRALPKATRTRLRGSTDRITRPRHRCSRLYIQNLLKCLATVARAEYATLFIGPVGMTGHRYQKVISVARIDSIWGICCPSRKPDESRFCPHRLIYICRHQRKDLVDAAPLRCQT